MGAQRVKITVDENQNKVHAGIGISTWSWRLSRISLGREYRKSFSGKDVRNTGSHGAGGSDPGMHPDPIYQSSIHADSSTGGNN